MDVDEEVKVACTAYVVSSEEFTYAGGSKKALKMVLDSSVYIAEKVLWADYDTGELKYPESLKKGAILYLFYSRKKNQKGVCYTNIKQIVVENKAIK